MRLVLAMLLQHEQNNLKTDVAPFTIYTPMFKAVVKQIRYCCRLWPKNCCKSRGFFYLLQQNLYILYILQARRPRVPTPARPPTTVITLTGDIMLAVIKNLFLVQMTGDMMVVAYCLERAHVGLSGLCHYWCGWARWHKTCIQEAV